MIRNDKFYWPGWLSLPLIILIAPLLPEYLGAENGVIENFQLLQLAYGSYFCYKASQTDTKLKNIPLKPLWQAGIIVFFLLFMREISWGRTFFTHADGSIYKYSEMGLYGKLVHPMVGLLMASLLYLFYQCRIWRLVPMVKFPGKSSLLLIIYAIVQYIGEHTSFPLFHGLVAEELAECGCYLMVFYIVADVKQEIQRLLDQEQ